MDKVTPKCPYCPADKDHPGGVEMGEIAASNACYYVCRRCESESPTILREECASDEDMCKRAYVAAMRRYQPENRVLTLEELRSIKQTVCIEYRNCGNVFFTEYALVDYSRGDGMSFTTRYGGRDKPSRKTHGVEWRCWMRRPTDDERKAVGWG